MIILRREVKLFSCKIFYGYSAITREFSANTSKIISKKLVGKKRKLGRFRCQKCF